MFGKDTGKTGQRAVLSARMLRGKVKITSLFVKITTLFNRILDKDFYSSTFHSSTVPVLLLNEVPIVNSGLGSAV